MKHLMTFESFVITSVNENMNLPTLSEEQKQKIQQYVNKNLDKIKNLFSPLKGKSVQEIINYLNPFAKKLQTPAATEGIVGNVLGKISTGVSVGSMASMLYGLFQLANTGSVTNFLTGGSIAMLASIVIYVLSLVFGNEKK